MIDVTHHRPVGVPGRVPVHKAAEFQAEKWLKAGLPKGHGLASPRAMAAQIAALTETILSVFRAQQERYARYIETHTPVLTPISKAAVRDLPPEALETYHA